MSDITDAPRADEPRADAAVHDAPRHGLWHRLYHGETDIDFVGKRKTGFVISGVLIAISLLSLGLRGLNLSIEFDGGTAWELPSGDLTLDAARSIVEGAGVTELSVQTLRSPDGGERLRLQAGPQTPEVQQAVQAELAEGAGLADVEEVSVNSIGPRWGEEITRAAIRALIFFFIAIAIYISIRFEWRMAVAALAAVVHDVLISVGIYSVFGFTVSPATVIAFLTILGFSLYDTIVVFDKVHENTRRFVTAGKTPYGDIVNLSMNQVLMRSINTSLAAVLPVLSLLVVGSWLLGAIALQDFALALLVGLLTGSYSSIFIATPVLAMLKTHQDQWAKIAERSGRTRSASLAHLREDQRATAVLRPTATSTAAASADPTIPARPRKKKR
jgi:preprotein translocase subunit SecF